MPSIVVKEIAEAGIGDIANSDPVVLIFIKRIEEARSRTCKAFFYREQCSLEPLFMLNPLYKSLKQWKMYDEGVIMYCEDDKCNVYDALMYRTQSFHAPDVCQHVDCNRVYISPHGGGIFVKTSHNTITALLVSFTQNKEIYDVVLNRYYDDLARLEMYLIL